MVTLGQLVGKQARIVVIDFDTDALKIKRLREQA